ncbi:Aste57867_18334 [Aphanomyces stellatus]|uniref:Aste57867_18334 protein n=1 Tax=Aphanomyces stellatus TaxID=120398 RepID=A0A485L9U2_9STRA|nr:hypothetical protein As57867_018272 [Aphanomyces stellatus]VFT95070.1 Aste57867_18334 [Aphanomyces stellatus]
MSVFVNVGQCGNQVGGALMAMAKETKGNRRREHMRCILVDTEPKVVRSIRAPAHVATVHMEQSGRGNNWAMGYNKAKNVDLCARVMESLRREIEATDCYRGGFILHSLAGGTGAGLGCRLLESMRDTYPKAYLVSGCVAPSMRGDTPLQNYNALFTLRHLQEYADAVLFKDNDDLVRSVAYWKSTQPAKESSVSLADMNALLAADWAGLLFPITQNKIRRVFDIGDFVTRVCPIPGAKFVDVRSAYYAQKLKPVSFSQYSSAAHQDPLPLMRLLVASFPRTTGLSLGQHIVVRGFKDPPHPLIDAVKKGIPRVEWGIPPPSMNVSTAPASPTVALSSLTVCSNGTNVIPTIYSLLERAEKQFEARAYVHWFKKYGVDDNYFEESFTKAVDILNEYTTLTAPDETYTDRVED